MVVVSKVVRGVDLWFKRCAFCALLTLAWGFSGSAIASDSSSVLTGTQTEKLRELTPDGTYTLRQQYHVPAGMELRIPPGAQIVAENAALLSVEGTLTVNGSRVAPVVFRGKGSGRSAWKGIRIEKSDTSVIRFAQIRNAEVGVQARNSKPTIYACVIETNTVGIDAGTYGSGSSPHIEHCIIAANKEHGIVLTGSRAKIVRCSIYRNGGWGIHGSYYASPEIEGSLITENGEGGVWCMLYECSVVAHECAIFNNSKLDMRNHGSKDWDCARNWWGETNTQILSKHGEGANLKRIEDGLDSLDATKNAGIVRLTGFLVEKPRVCGASFDEAEEALREKTNAESQHAIQKGSKVRLSRSSYVVLSADHFTGFHKSLAERDTAQVDRYVKAGYVIEVDAGTNAVALAERGPAYGVRILDGEHKGREGWVLRDQVELVQRTNTE